MMLQAFICGLIWSVMWSVYVFLILKFYPFSMLHDYPKDIQAAATIEKPSKAQEQAEKRFGAAGGLIIFGVLLAFGLPRFHSEQASFLQVLQYIFIVAMTWNVVDLLVMDWLIVCTITPEWIVIKGTGTNSADEAVDLPQTGNNSMTDLLMVLSAVMSAVIGVFAVKISGIVRRREDKQ